MAKAAILPRLQDMRGPSRLVGGLNMDCCFPPSFKKALDYISVPFYRNESDTSIGAAPSPQCPALKGKPERAPARY